MDPWPITSGQNPFSWENREHALELCLEDGTERVEDPPSLLCQPPGPSSVAENLSSRVTVAPLSGSPGSHPEWGHESHFHTTRCACLLASVISFPPCFRGTGPIFPPMRNSNRLEADSTHTPVLSPLRSLPEHCVVTERWSPCPGPIPL